MKDSKIYNKILFFSLILIYLNNIYAWKASAFLESFDKDTNEWNILLSRLMKNPWTVFSLESTTKGQKGEDLAQKAIFDQTSGLYNLDLSNTDWMKFNNDVVHFIDTSDNFYSAKAIYKHVESNPNNQRNDFAWYPMNDLIKQGFVLRKDPKSGILNKEQIDPEVIKILIASKSDEDSWFNIKNAIYFYDSNQPYYEFTNFAAYPINLDGKLWPTSEQYYQAQKFTQHPEIQERIRQFASPRQAFNEAQNNKKLIDADWQDRSLEAMVKAVIEKFTQHKFLLNLLKSTNNRILVENAGANDAFYGAGADGKGKNHLGQILMYVRDILNKKIDPKVEKYISHDPSYFKKPEKKQNFEQMFNSFLSLNNNLVSLKSLSGI